MRNLNLMKRLCLFILWSKTITMDSSARRQQLHICIGERKVAIVIKVVTKSEVRENWQGTFKDNRKWGEPKPERWEWKGKGCVLVTFLLPSSASRAPVSSSVLYPLHFNSKQFPNSHTLWLRAKNKDSCIHLNLFLKMKTGR